PRVDAKGTNMIRASCKQVESSSQIRVMGIEDQRLAEECAKDDVVQIAGDDVKPWNQGQPPKPIKRPPTRERRDRLPFGKPPVGPVSTQCVESSAQASLERRNRTDAVRRHHDSGDVDTRASDCACPLEGLRSQGRCSVELVDSAKLLSRVVVAVNGKRDARLLPKELCRRPMYVPLIEGYRRSRDVVVVGFGMS